MANNYFNRFIEWQNYAHYVLLGLITSAIVYFFELYGLPPLKMLLYFIAIIFIVDSIIHALFWFAQKPLRWRD